MSRSISSSRALSGSLSNAGAGPRSACSAGEESASPPSAASTEQTEGYAALIRWHKALRREVALNESFFPLGSWRQPSVVEWDGFARLSRAGEGVLALFRNASGADCARVQVPLPVELPDGARYELRSAFSGAALGARTAAEFRAGVDLAFEAGPVLVVEVRRR